MWIDRGAGASNALMDAYRLSETILSATEVCGQGKRYHGTIIHTGH